MPFHKLRLIEPLLRAVHSEGYTIPTEIQKQAIPHVLEGKDLLGCAQTGTGKTAAFSLPILHLLHERKPHSPLPQHGSGGHMPRRPIRALVLTPTRELAAQIGQSFGVYGQHTQLRHTVVFGGVSQGPQGHALKKGVDILVATPGRLQDLLNQRLLTLKDVEIFVLDEADRMLDMGFIQDIRRITALLPAERQTLMFSATMPREIRILASALLREPVEVKVAAESPAADTVKQCLYHVEAGAKPALLEHLLKDPEFTRALVFTRTKRGADRVSKRLLHGGITAEAIHSDKSQNARTRALENFKQGRTRVLIASDIAARGLDVDEISHVINYDLPNEPETYVHRIGRTGRAGAQGKAISFCTQEQRDELRGIEKLLGRAIHVEHHTIKASPKDIAAAEIAQAARQQQAAQRSHGQRKASQGRRQGSGHGHTTQASGHSAGGATHGTRRPPSPEKQQENFWRKKQKSRRPLQARSRRR